MLTQLVQARARAIARNVASVVAKTGLTPNMLTMIGFVVNVVAASFLATGHLVVGGLVMIFAGLFDMLDGALAKVTNKESKFGAFLDSVVDRYSEAVILFGLFLYYYNQPGETALVQVILIYSILVGSMMISYSRARAEAMDIANEGGIMARPERIILLAIGLVFWTVLLDPVLWILAVGTQFTALQRIFYVWQVTSGRRKGQE
jgi:CDP-diacylglycerol---glycerol-3-phosphate 3-phosphatidyltransferase